MGEREEESGALEGETKRGVLKEALKGQSGKLSCLFNAV